LDKGGKDMTRKEEIQSAFKIWQLMAQLQSILWDRYHQDLVDLLQHQEDAKALRPWTKNDDAPF
jgi:hypothetical protein